MLRQSVLYLSLLLLGGLEVNAWAPGELDAFPHRGRGGLIFQRFKRSFQQKYGVLKEGSLLSSESQNVFQQELDHHDASKGTFDQRYFEDSTYFDPDQRTVFLQLCGEGI